MEWNKECLKRLCLIIDEKVMEIVSRNPLPPEKEDKFNWSPEYSKIVEDVYATTDTEIEAFFSSFGIKEVLEDEAHCTSPTSVVVEAPFRLECPWRNSSFVSGGWFGPAGRFSFHKKYWVVPKELAIKILALKAIL